MVNISQTYGSTNKLCVKMGQEEELQLYRIFLI